MENREQSSGRRGYGKDEKEKERRTEGVRKTEIDDESESPRGRGSLLWGAGYKAPGAGQPEAPKPSSPLRPHPTQRGAPHRPI